MKLKTAFAMMLFLVVIGQTVARKNSNSKTVTEHYTFELSEKSYKTKSKFQKPLRHHTFRRLVFSQKHKRKKITRFGH